MSDHYCGARTEEGGCVTADGSDCTSEPKRFLVIDQSSGAFTAVGVPALPDINPDQLREFIETAHVGQGQQFIGTGDVPSYYIARLADPDDHDETCPSGCRVCDPLNAIATADGDQADDRSAAAIIADEVTS